MLVTAKTRATGSAVADRVEFLVDGSSVATDAQPPFEGVWKGATKGHHVITARVFDGAGRQYDSPSVSVFVGIRGLQRSIESSDDDAEEFGDGQMYLDSSDLELTTPDRADQAETKGDNLDQVVAMRFADIPLPKAAQIKKAYLQFTVDEVDTEQTNLVVHAELAGNAEPFDGVDRNITSRRKTTASVKWSPEPWEIQGQRSEKQRTSDLCSLIQEVVAQGDWRAGNTLVFIISGSGKRVAESFDGDPSAAPMLAASWFTLMGKPSW